MTKSGNLTVLYKKEDPKKKEISGQICIVVPNNGSNEAHFVEQRIKKCEPYYAHRYWLAMKYFLDSSGKYSKPLHLAMQITADEERLREARGYEAELIQANLARYKKTMKANFRCDNIAGLNTIAKKKKKDMLRALTELIDAAKSASVDPKIYPEEYDAWIENFVLLDERHLGSCRREFYRSRFLNPALKKLKEDPNMYVEPISMIFIEELFGKDDEFREKFEKRRQRKQQQRR